MYPYKDFVIVEEWRYGIVLQEISLLGCSQHQSLLRRRYVIVRRGDERTHAFERLEKQRKCVNDFIQELEIEDRKNCHACFDKVPKAW